MRGLVDFGNTKYNNKMLSLISKAWKIHSIRAFCSLRPNLLTQLEDEQLTEKLIGNVTSRKFKLKSIKSDIEFLHSRKFPLPDSLNESQWQKLFQFENHESRTLYLDSIKQNVEDF